MSNYRSIPPLMMRLLSNPIQLHWMGWRTDTLELQRNGWELSAEQDPCYRTLRIAARHKENRVYAISDREQFNYSHMRGDDSFRHETNEIRMQLAHEILITEVNSTIGSMFKFNPIDCEPSISSYQVRSLDELAHFKKIPINTNQILLEQASLDDVLNYALSKQSRKQEEIRREMIKRKELENLRIGSTLHSELRLVA